MIVAFPDADDKRTLQASLTLLNGKIAQPVLVGNPDKINKVAADNELNIKDILVYNPDNSELSVEFANLLFEKSMYQHALLENNYVSGDDIFLLLQIKKQYPKSIHFIKSTDSIVYTKPAISLQEFFEQRIRWASKSKAYRDIDIVFVAVIVALVNYILTFSLLASVFYKHIFYYYLFFLVIKSVIDLSLLYPFNYFFKRHRLMWLFIPLQIIYPFYITYTSIAGLAGRFTWKNRNFR